MARAAALFILTSAIALSANALTLELNAVSWNEINRISIAGDSKEIKTTIYGAGLGSEFWTYTRGNRWRWGTYYSFGAGNAHTANRGDDFTFSETYLLASWVSMSPGFRYLLNGQKMEIGLQLPLMYRIIDYKVLAAETSFPDKGRFISFAEFEARWAYSARIRFFQRLGVPLISKTSTLWVAGLCYIF